MRTLAELAREALDVQDAYNPLGLSKSYAESIQELAYLMRDKSSLRDIAWHPINRLWASKLHDLASMGLSDIERYSEAYKACQALAIEDDEQFVQC